MAKKEVNVKISTIIGKDAECMGDFTASDSLRVDGTIHGKLTVEGAVIIGSTGLIEGNISAKSVVVGGRVIGNIQAPERVELIGTAQVYGDISTGVLVIDEKAVFQGRCDMNREIPSEKGQPGLKAALSGRKTAKAAIVQALKADEEEQQANQGETAVAASADEKTETVEA